MSYREPERRAGGKEQDGDDFKKAPNHYMAKRPGYNFKRFFVCIKLLHATPHIYTHNIII